MLAEELIELQRAPREVTPFSGRYPHLTSEAGYAASRALHEHRLAQGWKPVGRKIGFTNRSLWPRYGVYEPIWGTVYDRTLIEASGGRASVSLAGLVNPRIEPEVCFRLKSAPRSPDPEALLGAIEWAAHAIEIVQSYHPGWKLSLADCTAANGLHARLVVGTPVALRELPALAPALPALQVVLKRNGAVIDRGLGANVLGSPLAALGYLVELLARQPEAPPLRAGEIVSTGVITDAHPVSSGEIWSTEIAGLPLAGLTVSFE
ncbi:MAG TPA: decarboxylase [Burkholderiales bacterium]|nr:decarboxylase [Burkholderiales bacterium]